MDQWKLGVPCRIKIFHHVNTPKVLLCGLLCLLSNFLSLPDFVVITSSLICIVSKFSTVTECLSQSGSFQSITLICCSRSVQLINPFLMRSSRQCVFWWWSEKREVVVYIRFSAFLRWFQNLGSSYVCMYLIWSGLITWGSTSSGHRPFIDWRANNQVLLASWALHRFCCWTYNFIVSLPLVNYLEYFSFHELD